MQNIPNKFLVTSALPYANGALHLGHFAGAYLPGDIYVRFLRSMGKDVVWVCGSDEHGASITIRAKKEKRSPKEIIDTYHTLNKESFEKLGMSFDIYHRTSEKLHHETVQEFFMHMYENGDDFEVQESEQFYDEEYDQFLADRYIKGTCPKCSHDAAYGDQCENCGSDLSPTELINPLSTLSGKSPSLRKTKHWFFKLDQHSEWLKEYINDGVLDGKSHHDAKKWKKHVKGQCLSWLDDLRPRAITRDLSWGIDVPLDDAEGKVFYVWFDAPIGYISATKQWALDNNKDWESYWKNEDTQLIHFIGKDNIVFHCIVFPAMLKAHGDYNLPINVPANQFLNFEGQKFSKSRNWGIEIHQYLEEFAAFENKEDALRYALIRNMPENKDSDFKWDEFVEFHDNELVANLGNFINRVIVLTNKYFDGVVPSASENAIDKIGEINTLIAEYQSEILDFNFRNAVLKMMEISSLGNTYLQDVSPWKMYKADPDNQEIKDCLYNCLQIVAILGAIAEPFIPFSAQRINTTLNAETSSIKQVLDRLSKQESVIKAGHQIGVPQLLFAKINDPKDSTRMDLIEREKGKLLKIVEESLPKTEPIKDTIPFEDFTKMDIRTAKVLTAEKVEKADKLLKLQVQMGIEQRTVVSGIAKHYKPEDLIGVEVLLLANLAPRKIRGVESKGMILMAENEKGELCLVSPNKPFGSGWVVR